ncbi:MAG TPA: tripartite tricarboxylate transporter substrate binding protein [Burkholderiales bacterium]|nr:tripartite tricarboxylate transporter substrate binding protein [Burkholderiales bacterium]
MHRLIALALMSAALICWAAGVRAQGAAAYPQRNVQLVVPYTPGTGADILARALGPRLADRWKVAVITDNRPGATGNIGTDFVAKAPPDGHTLLVTATSFGTVPALTPRLPFDPVKSFAPVVQIAASELTFVVHPQLPVKSVREFIQLAKRRPGELLYSSPGNGGPQHLTTELIKLEAGIDIVHVPYKGAAGAITDLVGGHVQAMVSAMQTISPQVRAGKLRMLAVMGEKRSAPFPDVPTMKEQGLPSLVVETWYGLFAPAGTPAGVVAKLNSDLNALLESAEVRELLVRQGMNAVGGTPERFGEMVRRELARWSRVVAVAKIKPD